MLQLQGTVNAASVDDLARSVAKAVESAFSNDPEMSLKRCSPFL
jgi:hypothetical protein